MPKQQTDYLLKLINSLTKAEKRHFKLFVTRNQSSSQLLFLKLFELLDKQKVYDESTILSKIPGIKKRQLSNLKAHLYKQLLMSLRLLARNHNPDIELRELIDYARVLYSKGLYRQALEILEKSKQKAILTKKLALHLEVLEFEKLIESQYITRSIDTRSEELTQQAKTLSNQIRISHSLSNLALQLYSLYLRLGYVRNEKDHIFVREFFLSNLPEHKPEELGFYESLYLFQSYCWYFYMVHDFIHYFKYAQKWVNQFKVNPEMINLETALHLKGYHNLLNSLFSLWEYERFVEVLDQFEHFANNRKSVDTNEEGLTYLFLSTHRINRHYMEGTYLKGTELFPDLLKVIKTEKYNWDQHRIMVLYYKIACMYFGENDTEHTIQYLNLIINQKSTEIREDIQCFARILCLIAHFEQGNDLLVEYQVKSVYRFLTKMDDMHEVQKEILRFIRRLPKTTKYELKDAFKDLLSRLIKHRSDPYERRPFLYLDIISWLEGKIEGAGIGEIVRRKFLNREKPLE